MLPLFIYSWLLILHHVHVYILDLIVHIIFLFPHSIQSHTEYGLWEIQGFFLWCLLLPSSNEFLFTGPSLHMHLLYTC